MKINSVILTIKKGNKEALALSRQIRKWLEEQGITVSMPSGITDVFECVRNEPKPGLIIVLGGDGTILSQAGKMLELEIPFLGVNLGKVGFMADISPHSWKGQLSQRLSSPGMSISSRIVLGYQLLRGAETIEKGCAINEVVINRGELARLITVELELPGGIRQDVRADGMIFSTPTGSTAYSVSAGGPLVHPDLEVLIITSICPFLDDFKPLVLPAGDIVVAGVSGSDNEAFLTVDGQSGYRLRPGDRILIRRYEKDFKLLCSPEHSFTSKLVAKRFLKEG